MSTFRTTKTKFGALMILGACFVCTPYASSLFDILDSGGKNDITAVASRKSKSYIRAQLANGSFIPESYVFGPGGVWQGGMADATIDKLTFSDVAHMIAGPLASQNYIPGKDPKSTKLLIMVYWGTSHGQEHASESSSYDNLQSTENEIKAAQMVEGPSPPHEGTASTAVYSSSPTIQALLDQETTEVAAVAAENRMREQDDRLNVMMLGYDSWWDETDQYENTPMRFRRQDLLDEIEENRYFVVLMAYDLQLMLSKKKHRLLWETRFSIRERHHAFNEDLPAMAQYASQFFGQDSHGLIHKVIPLGRVDIGTVKSLGEVPEKPGADSARPSDKP